MNDQYKQYSFTWHGDVTSVSSTAQHSRRLIEPLIKGGAHVRIQPTKAPRPQEKMTPWWDEKIKAAMQAPPGLIHVNCTPPDAGIKNPTGGPTAILTHWETLGPPRHWEKHLFEGIYDEIWVPTEGLKAQLDEMEVDQNVRVLPYAIDSNFAKAGTRAELHGVDDKTFVFGYTGLWNNRKNISDAIIAYLGAFSSADDVALVIKTNGSNPADVNERKRIAQMVKEIKKSFNRPDLPKIVLLQEILSQPAMDSVIRRFDCFISSSRGEGRNITMLKAMAMGTPCIYTNILGSKDIADKLREHLNSTGKEADLLFPVGWTTEPVMQMGNYYTAANMWARPLCGDLMGAMRHVHMRHLMNPYKKESMIMASATQKLFNKNRLPEILEEAQPFAIQRLA